jgi:hypothetical protein
MFTERYSYGRKPAAVFTEMVALYNDEREQYSTLCRKKAFQSLSLLSVSTATIKKLHGKMKRV